MRNVQSAEVEGADSLGMVRCESALGGAGATALLSRRGVRWSFATDLSRGIPHGEDRFSDERSTV